MGAWGRGVSWVPGVELKASPQFQQFWGLAFNSTPATLTLVIAAELDFT